MEPQEIIKYIHATPDHEFLIGKTLTQSQGLTHDVFKPIEVKEEEGEAEPQNEENAEAVEDAGPKPVPKEVPHHKYISEVVRESRMHYFKVPKLGSYLAVEVKYNS